MRKCWLHLPPSLSLGVAGAPCGGQDWQTNENKQQILQLLAHADGWNQGVNSAIFDQWTYCMWSLAVSMAWHGEASHETKDGKSFLELFAEVITVWQYASHPGCVEKRGDGFWLKDLLKETLKCVASCLTVDHRPPILSSALQNDADKGYCKNPLNNSHSALITRMRLSPWASWRAAKGRDKMSIRLKIGSRYSCSFFPHELLINQLQEKQELPIHPGLFTIPDFLLVELAVLYKPVHLKAQQRVQVEAAMFCFFL